MATTMTSAKERRLFCVGENIVVLIGDEIVETIDIDEDLLKREIKKQIEMLQEEENKLLVKPVIVFERAIEGITGIKFKPLFYKLNGKITIHESPLYRHFLEFISQESNFKEKMKLQKEITLKRNEALKKQRVADTYYFESIIKQAGKKAVEEKRRKS